MKHVMTLLLEHLAKVLIDLVPYQLVPVMWVFMMIIPMLIVIHVLVHVLRVQHQVFAKIVTLVII